MQKLLLFKETKPQMGFFSWQGVLFAVLHLRLVPGLARRGGRGGAGASLKMGYSREKWGENEGKTVGGSTQLYWLAAARARLRG